MPCPSETERHGPENGFGAAAATLGAVNPARPRLLVLLPSADGYGSDRALVAALPRLARDLEPVLVSAADGPTLDAARALGFECHVTPDFALRRRALRPAAVPATTLRVARSLATIRSMHRRRPFDLVYVNTVALALLPGLRAALGGREAPPIVVHVREVPRTSGRLNLVHFGVISRLAARVVANSTSTAGFVRDLVPALDDRLVVVHDGVDDPGEIALVAPGASRRLRITCVGRIHPQKGQGVLIEALRRGAAAGHDWEVHLWGDALPEHAALEAELHDAVRSGGLEDRVVWHGYSADTNAMYAGADVAVVPSTWPEGFSLVCAEAQLHGLPTVATGPGGPSDILDDGVTGRIVGFDDPDALVTAFVELEDPQRRAAWGVAARRRALERFTTERYAERLTAELEELVTSSPAVPAVAAG